MKQLLLFAFLFIGFGPCRANSHSFTFNYNNLVSVQIIVADTLLPDTNLSDQEMFLRGKRWGLSSYDKYTAETTVIGATFLVMPVGLLLAGIVNAKKPNPDKFTFADQENLKNASYRAGFQEGLLYTKRSRVWTGFWQGWGVSILVSLGFVVFPVLLMN